MPPLSEVVDHASRQTDRWLFLFMLALVIGGGLLVIKYLVKRAEAESERLHASYDRNIDVSRELGITLAKNTEALSRSNELHVKANELHTKTLEALQELERAERQR